MHPLLFAVSLSFSSLAALPAAIPAQSGGDVYRQSGGAQTAIADTQTRVGGHQSRPLWTVAEIEIRPAEPTPSLSTGLLQAQSREDSDAAFREVLAGLLQQRDAALAAGDSAEAERMWLQILSLGSIYSHLRLGDALADLDRFEDAAAAYQEGIRLAPDNAFMHHRLGFTRYELGDFEAAEQAQRDAIRLGYEYDFIYFHLGRALYRQNRVEEAEAAFEEALRLDFLLPFELGEQLIEQRQFDEAGAFYRAALRFDPENAFIYINQAETLAEQGFLEAAETAYREIIQFNPTYVQAHFGLGLLLAQQSRLDEAETVLRETMQLTSDATVAEPVTSADGAGRFEETEALERDIIRFQAPFLLGLVLAQQEQFVAAEAAFRDAIAIEADYADAYTNLGLVLVEQGRAEEAETATREAIRLWPDDPSAHNSLGVALREQERLTEAEAAHREAIRLNPNFAYAHYSLGLVLERQGRLEEAEAAFEQADRLFSAP